MSTKIMVRFAIKPLILMTTALRKLTKNAYNFEIVTKLYTW